MRATSASPSLQEIDLMPYRLNPKRKGLAWPWRGERERSAAPAIPTNDLRVVSIASISID
jgi:hypothetical protein